MIADVQTVESPIEEIYRIRQEISARYDHDPEKLYLAMVAYQRELVKQGQVFWGYNEAGELAPLQVR